MAESFRAVACQRIDPHRRVNSFEVFGFDFMIDEDFCVWLIEGNTNPCLEINGCPVLARVIPPMLECAFRIALDPALPPPDLNFKKGIERDSENKFSLIFDAAIEGPEIKALYDKLYGTDDSDTSQLREIRGEEEDEEDDDEPG